MPSSGICYQLVLSAWGWEACCLVWTLLWPFCFILGCFQKLPSPLDKCSAFAAQKILLLVSNTGSSWGSPSRWGKLGMDQWDTGVCTTLSHVFCTWNILNWLIKNFGVYSKVQLCSQPKICKDSHPAHLFWCTVVHPGTRQGKGHSVSASSSSFWIWSLCLSRGTYINKQVSWCPQKLLRKMCLQCFDAFFTLGIELFQQNPRSCESCSQK